MGGGMLEAIHASPRKLCEGHVALSEPFSEVVMYSHYEGTCGSTDPPGGKVTAFQNVRMDVLANASMRVQCSDRGLDQIRSEAPGLVAEEHVDWHECSRWVEEDAMLVMNPRGEYFSNLYHNVEEVFSMVETATLLGRDLREFRLLFAWGHAGGELSIYEFATEHTGAWMSPPPQAKALAPLLEVWDAIVRHKHAPLQPSGPSGSVCFRRLAFPVRACSGSVVPLTWYPKVPCSRGSPLAGRVVRLVMEAVGQWPPAHRDRASNVTFLTRRTRQLLNEANATRAIGGLAGVALRAVGLDGVSFADQVKIMRETDVLVGAHGAGLTHLMWLPQGSGIVEITNYAPPQKDRVVYNIFANLAKWTRHPYKSVWPDAEVAARAVRDMLQTRA